MVDAVKILGALLGGGGLSSGSGAGILKSVLGAATSGNQGGLGDLLGSVLGGSQSSQGGSGQGDLLGSVLGGSQSGQGGGLGDALGGLLGGNQAASQRGGLGDLLGGILGGTQGGGGQGGSNDLGSLVSAALNQFGQSEKAAQENIQPLRFEEHSPGLDQKEAGEQATLMIRAMINAAKADGKVDQKEHRNIVGKLGQVTQEEIEFVNRELAQPLDVSGFAHSVPAAMGNQVYAMSLMAIDLDTNPEAQYLHQLAQGLNITPQVCNQIHQQLGAPPLYPE